jgi:hypothetical protein
MRLDAFCQAIGRDGFDDTWVEDFRQERVDEIHHPGINHTITDGTGGGILGRVREI